jgi:hypothetical protein
MTEPALDAFHNAPDDAKDESLSERERILKRVQHEASLMLLIADTLRTGAHDAKFAFAEDSLERMTVSIYIQIKREGNPWK